jgi:hypothetical protein
LLLASVDKHLAKRMVSITKKLTNNRSDQTNIFLKKMTKTLAIWQHCPLHYQPPTPTSSPLKVNRFSRKWRDRLQQFIANLPSSHAANKF